MLIAFPYPTYRSLKAILSDTKEDDIACLRYLVAQAAQNKPNLHRPFFNIIVLNLKMKLKLIHLPSVYILNRPWSFESCPRVPGLFQCISRFHHIFKTTCNKGFLLHLYVFVHFTLIILDSHTNVCFSLIIFGMWYRG